MAVTEGEGTRRKKPLPQWDSVPKSDPRDIPGTRSYQPLAVPGPVRGSRYDPSRLQKLTPYASPVQIERERQLQPSSIGAPGARAGRPMPESDAPFAPGGMTRATPRTVAIPGQEAETTETLERQGKEKTRRSYQLTWDEYRKLNDEQRAAVDFNTILVQAREKDLNADYQATTEQLEKFDERTERMFGEGRGSETFAPETLAVLKDIDFKGSGEDDLDDFLGLKTAIKAKDLKGFSFDRAVRPPEVADTPEVARVRQVISPGGAGGLESSQRAGVYTRNLQEAIARAGKVLQTWKATATRSRYDDVLGLGGDPDEAKRARGYGQPKPFTDSDNDGLADEYSFSNLAQDTLATLSNPKMDPSIALNAIGTLDAKDKQDMMRYLDEQTRVSLATGTGVLGIEQKNGRGADEIRRLLGLGRGAR